MRVRKVWIGIQWGLADGVGGPRRQHKCCAEHDPAMLSRPFDDPLDHAQLSWLVCAAGGEAFCAGSFAPSGAGEAPPP